MGTLPPCVKQAIIDDINSLHMTPLTILRMRRGVSTRVVAVLFLRLLAGADFGGVWIPGETRPTSMLTVLNVTIAMAAISLKTFQSGVELSGENRERRPEIWQLAEQDMTDEAILRLEQDPALIRQFHRGFTIVHQACFLGNHELLSVIIRLDSEVAQLKSHFGVKPLACALLSESRGGTECLRLLLDAKSDTTQVYANGLTVLESLYVGLLLNSFIVHNVGPCCRSCLESRHWTTGS